MNFDGTSSSNIIVYQYQFYSNSATCLYLNKIQTMVAITDATEDLRWNISIRHYFYPRSDHTATPLNYLHKICHEVTGCQYHDNGSDNRHSRQDVLLVQIVSHHLEREHQSGQHSGDEALRLLVYQLTYHSFMWHSLQTVREKLYYFVKSW